MMPVLILTIVIVIFTAGMEDKANGSVDTKRYLRLVQDTITERLASMCLQQVQFF